MDVKGEKNKFLLQINKVSRKKIMFWGWEQLSESLFPSQGFPSTGAPLKYPKWEWITSNPEFVLIVSQTSKVTSRKHESVCVCVFVLGCDRLYPVGTTVQRYPIKDIVLQNYHVPAGVSDQTVTLIFFFSHRLISAHKHIHHLSPQTMVQACLYPLGRSADVFEEPQRFHPGRWGSSREEGQQGEGSGFRSLAFGFGARQCVGRRIAENEMQLLLMHVSDREGGWLL